MIFIFLKMENKLIAFYPDDLNVLRFTDKNANWKGPFDEKKN